MAPTAAICSSLQEGCNNVPYSRSTRWSTTVELWRQATVQCESDIGPTLWHTKADLGMFSKFMSSTKSAPQTKECRTSAPLDSFAIHGAIAYTNVFWLIDWLTDWFFLAFGVFCGVLRHLKVHLMQHNPMGLSKPHCKMWNSRYINMSENFMRGPSRFYRTGTNRV